MHFSTAPVVVTVFMLVSDPVLAGRATLLRFASVGSELELILFACISIAIPLTGHNNAVFNLPRFQLTEEHKRQARIIQNTQGNLLLR